MLVAISFGAAAPSGAAHSGWSGGAIPPAVKPFRIPSSWTYSCFLSPCVGQLLPGGNRETSYLRGSRPALILGVSDAAIVSFRLAPLHSGRSTFFGGGALALAQLGEVRGCSRLCARCASFFGGGALALAQFVTFAAARVFGLAALRFFWWGRARSRPVCDVRGCSRFWARCASFFGGGALALAQLGNVRGCSRLWARCASFFWWGRAHSSPSLFLRSRWFSLSWARRASKLNRPPTSRQRVSIMCIQLRSLLNDTMDEVRWEQVGQN